MRRVVPLLIVLCLGFAPAPVYREKPDTRTDLEKMQGSWRLVYTVKDGKRKNVAQTCLYTIDGNRLFTSTSVVSSGASRIVLHSRSKPSAIDICHWPEGEPYFLGRYSVEGDTLKISLGEKRPTNLTGNGSELEVYNRERP